MTCGDEVDPVWSLSLDDRGLSEVMEISERATPVPFAGPSALVDHRWYLEEPVVGAGDALVVDSYEPS